MQIHESYAPLLPGVRPADLSLSHFKRSAEVLCNLLEGIALSQPNWSRPVQMGAAVAAYNTGLGVCKSLDNIDRYTQNGDYSNDILIRAQCYREPRSGAH